MSKPEKQLPRRVFAYLGMRRWLKGNKLCHAYLPVDAAEWSDADLDESSTFETACIFSKPIARWMRPGDVFTIEHNEDDAGRVIVNSNVSVGRYPQEACARLQALSQAAADSVALEKKQKRESGRDIPLEVLEPLQQAYRRLRTKTERAVLLGRIIDHITRGTGL